MALLDPAERSARGAALQAEITGRPAREPRTLYEESWRDFLYAEVWSSPGLDRRSRYLIAIAGCVVTKADDELFDDFVYGALKNKELTVTELREAALHMGPYGGWMGAARLDKAITRAAEELGLPPAENAPIRAEPWDPKERDAEGAAEFKQVMAGQGSGPPVVPYLEAIHNFVFGEMWLRRSLDERSRRWLTLVGVCDSTTDIPVRSHVYAAMASGNCTVAEMHEFVLQFGTHCGWPKASEVQGAVFAMAKNIEAGLSWMGD